MFSKSRRELPLLSTIWPVACFDCMASAVAVGVYTQELILIPLRKSGDLKCSDQVGGFILTEVECKGIS